jgi:hypothetical protein
MNNYKLEKINLLIDNQLFEDAYDLLKEYPDKNDVDYLFYLAFLEAQLGQKFESMETLRKLYAKSDIPDKISAIFHGFTADIMHDEGWKRDALEEIITAHDLDPDDELIKEKMEEFTDDFGDDLKALLILILIYKQSMNNKEYK